MSGLRQRVDEARLAFLFLTRVPVGRLEEPLPSLAAARWAFPFAGLIVGGVGWAVFALAGKTGLQGLLQGLLAYGAMVLVSGALHHDGLADLADGLGGGRDKEHCLEIMADPRIGSFGVIALILAIAIGVGGIAEAGAVFGLGFLAIAVASRVAMAVVLVALPSARGEGLGRDAAGTGGGDMLPGAILAAVLLVLLGAPGLMAGLAMAGVGALVAWRAHRRLGGQTGDVAGAVQVSSEAAGWVALAALS
ncbi:MAG: adenosylcobinamide-GDP ribazoletransferase [Pseudomonadota bacterium]